MKLLAFILLASVWMGCQQMRPAAVPTYVKPIDEIYHDSANVYFWIAVNKTLDTATRNAAHKKFDYWNGIRMAEVKKQLIAKGYGEWLKCDSLDDEDRRIRDSIQSLPKKKRPKRIHTDNQSVNINGDNNGEIIQLR